MSSAKNIGRRIVELRKTAKLTQDDLAVAIGLSRSTIAGIESGGASAGFQSMVAIADYFKVPLDWLVGRRCPTGGPLVTQIVDDPDELAWLSFWRNLDDRRREAMLMVLQIPGAKAVEQQG
jgi:transcriptional regulator with XRE-family HTH domain